MKKLLVLSALSASLFLTWSAMSSDPACAMGGCRPGGMTLPAWGMGSSCQAAINQAINLASNQIPWDCDECGESIPIEVTPCHQCGEDPNDPEACTAANQYRADYKIRYFCEQDIDLLM